MRINSRNAQAFTKHITNISLLAGIDTFEAEKLFNRLVRLEKKAHRLCEYECNTGEDMDDQLKSILLKVKKLLNVADCSELDDAVFINGDPRGYALKIRSEYVAKHNIDIYRDWGGYGILAPDFN